MRFLVTGARGQLGGQLVDDLDAHPDHMVLGVDRPGGDLGGVAGVDLVDRAAAVELVGSFRPEVVVHAAAFTDVDGCETDPDAARRNNVEASESVAIAARTVDAHVVYVSTDYVFDGTKSTPYVETDVPNPQSVYGRTKLAGEAAMDPAWTVARTSWLCSARGANMVRTILRLSEGDAELRFVDDQRGHPTFAADLSPMLVRLGEDRVAGIVHTTNLGAVSWAEFAREVLLAAGRDPARVVSIATADLQPPRPAHRPANSVLADVAWRALGYAPNRDFREPLAEAVRELLDR
ncbi:MAG: dTDP-4-dehydrorhamnose reductase [Microthrixaceae bacterium]